MINWRCPNCGATQGFIDRNGTRKCGYCESEFLFQNEDLGIKCSNVSTKNDVANLLEKCKSEPWNAKRYANLILDIDPSNKEAYKYLF